MITLPTMVLVFGITAGLMGLAYGMSAVDSYSKARHDSSRNSPMWLVTKTFTKMSVCFFVAAAILFLIYFFVLR